MVCVCGFSLRAQFSRVDSSINQLHGSGSSEEAEREIGFFFPAEDTLAVIKPDTEHKGIISAVTLNTVERVQREILALCLSCSFHTHAFNATTSQQCWQDGRRMVFRF